MAGPLEGGLAVSQTLVGGEEADYTPWHDLWMGQGGKFHFAIYLSTYGMNLQHFQVLLFWVLSSTNLKFQRYLLFQHAHLAKLKEYIPYFLQNSRSLPTLKGEI